ncbi:prostaglandin E2 receptor EP2 subtype [Petromyzon marinus]|uniref:Prostaglandin E2 receptor EP2 subtype-like n=1 Tax=Petromyzon marinus TaxID=7757 RepID=A0AAJ7T633_PETMA|nr:prostaglandin E2 receptor EP2 subtype-like [Petromyzon marinus]
MNESQEQCATIPVGSSATPAALMFCVGVVGNGAAASILWCSRPDSKRSVFFTLVCALTATDLLSTLLSSPVVLTAYSRNSTLRELGGDSLCLYFTCCMLFFGAATMGILFAMAFERCLSLSHPYAYRRLVRRAGALGALAGIYLLSLLASLMPVMRFGRSRMYKPCTWCYVEMRHEPGYSVLYALFLSALIVAVLACNASVMLSLHAMRRRLLSSAPPAACRGCQQPRTLSLRRKLSLHRRMKYARGVEVDNLVLLVVMTLIFLICSLPLTVSAFINAIDPGNNNFGRDLTGLRFASFNPILDPWIFIIFRRSVFERLRSVLCYCLVLPRHKRNAASASLHLHSEPPSSLPPGAAHDPASSCHFNPWRSDSCASNCACDASRGRPWQADPGPGGHVCTSDPCDLRTREAKAVPHGCECARTALSSQPRHVGPRPGACACTSAADGPTLDRQPQPWRADSGPLGHCVRAGAAGGPRGLPGSTAGAAVLAAGEACAEDVADVQMSLP